MRSLASLSQTTISGEPMGEKPPVHLGDISGASIQERFKNFYLQNGCRVSAREDAVDEMMNEQHAMLMAICEKLGIEVGG